jgi:hypothetical protein
MPDRAMLEKWRKAFLEIVDAIERNLGQSPRTAELRRMARGKIVKKEEQEE